MVINNLVETYINRMFSFYFFLNVYILCTVVATAFASWPLENQTRRAELMIKSLRLMEFDRHKDFIHTNENALATLKEKVLNSGKKNLSISAYGSSVSDGAKDLEVYFELQQRQFYGYISRTVDFLAELLDGIKTVTLDNRAKSASLYNEHLYCRSEGQNADIILMEFLLFNDLQYFEKMLRNVLALPQRPVVIIVKWQPEAGLANHNFDIAFSIAEHYSLSIVGQMVNQSQDIDNLFPHLYADEIHPSSAGHELLASMLKTLVLKAMAFPMGTNLLTDDSALPKPFSNVVDTILKSPRCYMIDGGIENRRLPKPSYADPCWVEGEKLEGKRKPKRWIMCKQTGGKIEYIFPNITAIVVIAYMHHEMGMNTTFYINGELMRKVSTNIQVKPLPGPNASKSEINLMEFQHARDLRGYPQMFDVAENLNPLQATTLTIIVGMDSLGLNTFQFHGIGVY